jgi:Na+-translocating ferredoxin:NAD+ oxidoreductase subunit E
MIKSQLRRGIIDQNPVFGMALGLCPALAVTTSLKNAAGMGLAVICVLLASNASISMIRRWIPYKVRIPCFLIIIATFVSMVDIFMKVKTPHLESSLGIFIPLMAVNCIILCRADVFASKNRIGASIVDAGTTGLGFFLALVLVAMIREALGENRLFGAQLIPHAIPMYALHYSCGGFFGIALVLGISNYLKSKKGRP